MINNMKRQIEENGWLWCLFDEENGRMAWATVALRLAILGFAMVALLFTLFK